MFLDEVTRRAGFSRFVAGEPVKGGVGSDEKTCALVHGEEHIARTGLRDCIGKALHVKRPHALVP
jgi:hypothetical protein